MPPLESVIAISIGAVPGALGRYYIALWSDRRFNTPIFGTLTVNLGGAFLMGVLSYSLTHLGMARWFSQGVTVGFLGALTTFSTFTLESAILWREHKKLQAWLYWLGSPLLGLGCVELGLALAQWLVPS